MQYPDGTLQILQCSRVYLEQDTTVCHRIVEICRFQYHAVNGDVAHKRMRGAVLWGTYTPISAANNNIPLADSPQWAAVTQTRQQAASLIQLS